MNDYYETAEDERHAPREVRPRAVRPGPQPGDSLGARQKRLWEAVDAIDSAVDHLTVRIAPALLPERAEGALAGVAENDAATSELSGFLDQLLDRMERLARRVGATADRVDL